MNKIFSAIISSPLKGRLGGVLFALLATTNLWAYDFKSGDLYYNITSDTTVEVTDQHRGLSDNYAGLTTATIPETVTYNATTYSVTSIGFAAFRFCSSLTSITIPNSVTSIGWEAFSGCSSLTSITIPNSVTSIGYMAFSDCSSLTSITIPNSVTSIGNFAFQRCSALTSITIPNSVTSIRVSAFYGTGIYNNESNWENGVLYISNCLIAAEDISGSYTIKDNTRLIAGGAFSFCRSLTSITIPNSVTSISVNVFENCSSLTSMVVESGNTTYDSRENCNAIIETATNTLIAGCQNTIIPNSVTSIGNYAFWNCSSLTSITIPNSVTSIGEKAFYACSALSSIQIEATTPPTLGNSAFASNLTAIYIPDNTLSTYQQAWGNEYTYVNNETTLTLNIEVPGILEDLIFEVGTRPALVAKLILSGTLNDNDFTCMRETMASLVDVDLSRITNTSGVDFRSKSKLVHIILPTNLASVEDRAFYGCRSLTSVTIPNSVTSIGWGAFYGCSSLTSITIPESVTSIGERAFYDCSSLTSVTIGNSVTSIGEQAFYDCSSLKTVICKAIEVPELESNVFNGMPLSEATLYVPAESLEDYKAADQWKEFGTILPLDKAPSAVENTRLPITNSTKLLRNGQLLILRDGKTYTITGQKL